LGEAEHVGGGSQPEALGGKSKRNSAWGKRLAESSGRGTL